MRQRECHLPADFRGFSPRRRLFRAQRAHLSRLHQHGSPRQIEIGQPDQGEHLGGILRQSFVARLGVAELPFDHPEEVFRSAANRGHLVVEPLVRRAQLVLGCGLQRHAPEDAGLPSCPLQAVVDIPLVAEHGPIVFPQQIRQLADIRLVGGGDGHRVGQAAIHIGTNMDLHAEIPLVAFLRLMHFRIALLRFVLGRGGSMNDRGVHHGATLEQQALLFQGVVDRIHDRRGQLVLLQQAAELQDRRLVRHRFVEQVQPGKRPHARHVVQRVFHAGIGEVEPLLHEIDAQHGLQAPRPATLARAFG